MVYETERRSQPVSVGSWIGTIILSAIPVVNVIYWIVLLFGGGNRNKVNLVRALLLLEVIIFGFAMAIGFWQSGSFNAFFTSAWNWVRNIGITLFDWAKNFINSFR